MPNYQDSKIYKLVGNGKIYVGSTVSALCRRKQQHITDYKRGKNMSSREIVTDPNHYIELIEYCPCNTKEELLKRERYYIEQIDCINKIIPGRTKQEYYEANRDKIKQYQQSNKDKIKAYKDAYYEANRDKIKQYQEATKDKRKAYQDAYRAARKTILTIDVDTIPGPI